MDLNAYLHFNDNCRDAFEFYRSVFGGEFDTLLTFADGPDDMPPLPEHELGRIMHVSLPVAGGVLMGSDSCSAFGPPPVAGDNFSIRDTLNKAHRGLNCGCPMDKGRNGPSLTGLISFTPQHFAPFSGHLGACQGVDGQ